MRKEIEEQIKNNIPEEPTYNYRYSHRPVSVSYSVPASVSPSSASTSSDHPDQCEVIKKSNELGIFRKARMRFSFDGEKYFRELLPQEDSIDNFLAGAKIRSDLAVTKMVLARHTLYCRQYKSIAFTREIAESTGSFAITIKYGKTEFSFSPLSPMIRDFGFLVLINPKEVLSVIYSPVIFKASCDCIEPKGNDPISVNGNYYVCDNCGKKIRLKYATFTGSKRFEPMSSMRAEVFPFTKEKVEETKNVQTGIN